MDDVQGAKPFWRASMWMHKHCVDHCVYLNVLQRKTKQAEKGW